MIRVWIFVFAFLPTMLIGQQFDSLIAVRVVDSLIQVSRGLTAEKNYPKALEVSSDAESIALEVLGRESAAYGSCCFNTGRVLYFKGDYPESEKRYLEAKEIREKTIGTESPEYAWSLNNLAVLYQSLGQNEKAESFFLLAKDVREKALGKEHNDYLWSLINLAGLYWRLGQYEKVEPLWIEVKAFREKVLEVNHPDYIQSLRDLGHLYYKMGKYEKAELFWLEVKSICENSLGIEHPEYASILNNLASLYSELGDYERAESLYIKAKGILGNSKDKIQPVYVAILNNLGRIYMNMGWYEKAEIMFIECLSLKEIIYNKDHHEYASSLDNLAILYQEMGLYKKAEFAFLEVSEILERTVGRSHPLFAECQINLGNFYYKIGNYISAERILLDATEIFEKFLGKEHPNYAVALNALGSLYTDLGQNEESEYFYQEALSIWRKTLGKEHHNCAAALQNIGRFYRNTGQYILAEECYIESISIRKNSFGIDHPEYAQGLHNLAILYTYMHQLEKARLLFLEAIAIFERKFGKAGVDYAINLNDLAIVYSNLGQYQEAESLHLESMPILLKSLGKDHPYYANFLKSMADMYLNMGHLEKAELLFTELTEVNRHLLKNAESHLSEKELNNYLVRFTKDQDNTLSFIQLTRRNSLTTTCYDNSLFYKGFLLQASAKLKRLAMLDEVNSDLYSRWVGHHRRLATQYAQIMSKRDSVQIKQLEIEAEEMEKELTRVVAGFDDARRQVSWQEVQSALQPEEAAVEFVHFRYSEKAATDSILYAALVLCPGMESPAFITLFEERTLDSLLSPMDRRKSTLANFLYTLPGDEPMLEDPSSRTLADLIWKPLESALANTSRVYVSPSGLLHRINLGAIPLSENEILADQMDVVVVNSTRQLVVPLLEHSNDSTAVLFGDIAYASDTSWTEGPMVAYRSQSEIHFALADSTLRGSSWTTLPATGKEVDGISRLATQQGWKVTTYTEENASETAFKDLGSGVHRSPRVIHLATHGYFFPDPKEAPARRSDQEPVFKVSEHPLLRSGLIMAGGNAGWRGKKRQEDGEDGVLTAYEISQMDLSNTELVVLSACETGLGDINGNEGVYGLQRAFRIAGVKYLIMSLWKVPDESTSLLMKTFYTKWLEDKMSIPEAFRAAQADMRALGYDPLQWAGFILVQ